MSVDCPHRERLGYLGDAHSSLETALSTVASDRFYDKWLQDIIDIQGYPAHTSLHKHSVVACGLWAIKLQACFISDRMLVFPGRGRMTQVGT